MASDVNSVPWSETIMCQFPCDATTGDRGVRDRRQAFARDVIDDVEHAKPSAAGELIMDEIQ